MKWKEYWKSMTNQEAFFKSAKLSKSELIEIQGVIHRMQRRNKPSSQIISFLQTYNKKLSEKWQAERAFWTEVKHQDTQKVAEAGETLDIDKYRVILSPSACTICKEKTSNGRKVFKNSDMKKSGYGHVPPFHPNCYCIVVPTD